VHVEWAPARIITVRVGDGADTETIEVAVLRERLRRQTTDGKILLEEHRVLTVPSGQPGDPRVITWESTLAAPPDGDPVTITGAPYHGLGIRFIQTMDVGGHFQNSTGSVAASGTNEARAAWCAYTAEPAPGKPVTVAVFDSPSNSRHPTRWFTMDKGFAYLAASLSVDTEPLRLKRGDRLTLRWGVAVFDGKATKAALDTAFARRQQLRQEVRTGSLPGLLGRYFAGVPEGRPAMVRVDRSIAFDWSDGMPDERVPHGPLSVTWEGDLLVDTDGTYCFCIDADGRANVWVDGRPVARPGTAPGPPVRMEFGFHPIRVEYRSAGNRPRLKLLWRFNQLPAEVINGRC
jgi:hypothetical protein